MYINFLCLNIFSSSLNASSDNENDSSNLEISHSRKELDAICRRNQSVLPSTLQTTYLSPVCEINTPTSATQSENIQVLPKKNPMITSKLFQEFFNKNSYSVLPTQQKKNLGQ